MLQDCSLIHVAIVINMAATLSVLSFLCWHPFPIAAAFKQATESNVSECSVFCAQQPLTHAFNKCVHRMLCCAGSVQGMWFMCRGEKTPWGTHIGGEEYPPDCECTLQSSDCICHRLPQGYPCCHISQVHRNLVIQ
jgi:hypothetical protein